MKFFVCLGSVNVLGMVLGLVVVGWLVYMNLLLVLYVVVLLLLLVLVLLVW